MSETAIIRPAATDDAPTLVDLRELMARDIGANEESRLASLRARTLPWIEEALADGRAYGWIAEQGERLAGGTSMTIVHGQPQYRAQDGRIAQIWGLYVYREFRGHGLGTALVREAVARAEALGCGLVTLHAAPRARSMYARLGFEPTSEMRLFVRSEA